MRSRAHAVVAPEGTIDTCGTGGDVRGTFNISTAAALVVAGAGVPVAKAGNRAVSSAAGSSDVMRALGLRVEQSAEQAEVSLRKDGFAYLHAPSFHPGMRHAGPVRMELGVRTAFNLIGPLANPARPRRQLVGVPDDAAAESVAAALHELGSERAFVVHGDRLDELPLDGSGVIFDVTPEGVQRRTVGTADHGLAEAPTKALRGGDGDANAALIVSVLSGAEGGAAHDVVALNAGAALVVAGRADELRDGVELAAATIASGAARAQLERLRRSAAAGAA
jgi:anthranilate phosphoribosyltransferase/anthranilate synthase/phosphoribosyltransferase